MFGGESRLPYTKYHLKNCINTQDIHILLRCLNGCQIKRKHAAMDIDNNASKVTKNVFSETVIFVNQLLFRICWKI